MIIIDLEDTRVCVCVGGRHPRRKIFKMYHFISEKWIFAYWWVQSDESNYETKKAIVARLRRVQKNNRQWSGIIDKYRNFFVNFAHRKFVMNFFRRQINFWWMNFAPEISGPGAKEWLVASVACTESERDKFRYFLTQLYYGL